MIEPKAMQSSLVGGQGHFLWAAIFGLSVVVNMWIEHALYEQTLNFLLSFLLFELTPPNSVDQYASGRYLGLSHYTIVHKDSKDLP